ncbi:MAG: hypothetical protein WC607_01935 [Candidatus Micrarchaeia archaeon]
MVGSALCEAETPGYVYRFEAFDENQLGEGLLALRAVATHQGFERAPIDRKAIEALARTASGKIKTLDDLKACLAGIKPNALKQELAGCVTRVDDPLGRKKGDEVDFAFSYYLHLLKQGVYPLRLPPGSQGKKGLVRLASNLDKWVVIKKINLGAGDDEAVAGAASMRDAISRKLFKLRGIAADAWLAQFNRKSFAGLSKVIDSLPERDGVNGELLLDAGFEANGFPTFISIEQSNGVYPYLKVPKPRGRQRKA